MAFKKVNFEYQVGETFEIVFMVKLKTFEEFYGDSAFFIQVYPMKRHDDH